MALTSEEIFATELISVMQFLAALLLAGSQIVFFLASQPLCNVSRLTLFMPLDFSGQLGRADEQASKGKINSSFLATLLQTASMVVIYFAWEVSLLPLTFPLFVPSPFLPFSSSPLPLIYFTHGECFSQLV